MRHRHPIRIVVADDHPVVCEGIGKIINETVGMSVAAKARNWSEAVNMAVAHRPDIALLDVHMPGMEAAEGVATIRRRCPETKIVMLSAFDHDEDIYRVVQAGAKGFLLKDCGQQEFRDCLRAVALGKTFLARGPAARLAARVQAPQLTERQTKILQLVAEGKTNKQVGAIMSITEGTVKVHVNHIFRKLGVEGRIAAITKALRYGLVRLSKGA